MTSAVRLDLHVHSRHSPDSKVTLADIAQRLPYTGLRGFALTDHNSIRGHHELATLHRSLPGYFFLPGAEVSTLEGHLLVYGVPKLPPLHRPAIETVEWVERNGGVSVIAHPFRVRHGMGRAVAEVLPATGIEARNGQNAEVTNLKAELLAAQRGLAATGGSDVHSIAQLGRTYTYFPDEVSNVDDLLEALRHHRTSAGGRSLSRWGRARVAVVTGAKYARRGFRSV